MRGEFISATFPRSVLTSSSRTACIAEPSAEADTTRAAAAQSASRARKSTSSRLREPRSWVGALFFIMRSQEFGLTIDVEGLGFTLEGETARRKRIRVSRMVDVDART